MQQRLGDLLDRFAVAVRDFGRGWGLLSERGAEIAREQRERDMDDWGIDLDDELRESHDERSPMRLADFARQCAEAVGVQEPRRGEAVDHGAR